MRFAELAPFELENDAYPHEAMIFSAEDRCQQVKIRMAVVPEISHLDRALFQLF